MKRKFDSLNPNGELTIWSSALSDDYKSAYNKETFKCFLTEDNFAVFVSNAFSLWLGKFDDSSDDVKFVRIKKNPFIVAVLWLNIEEKAEPLFRRSLRKSLNDEEKEIVDHFIFFEMGRDVEPLKEFWKISCPMPVIGGSPYLRKRFLLDNRVRVDVDDPSIPWTGKKNIFDAGVEMLNHPEKYEDNIPNIAYLRYAVIDLDMMPKFHGINEMMGDFLAKRGGIRLEKTSFCVAGSAVLAGVLKFMKKTFMSHGASFKPGDIDIFIHPTNEEDLKIFTKQNFITRTTLKDRPFETRFTGLFELSEPVLSVKLVAPDYSWIQLIPVTNKTPFRIIQEFDIAPCQFAYFRGKVYATAHSYHSVMKGNYYVPLQTAGWRVEKYMERGFTPKNLFRFVYSKLEEAGERRSSLHILSGDNVQDLEDFRTSDSTVKRLESEKPFSQIEDGLLLQERNYTAHSCQRFWFNRYFKSLLKKE